MAGQKTKLILAMLQTLSDLGNSRMARIDARAWHKHYVRKARKAGVKTEGKK